MPIPFSDDAVAAIAADAGVSETALRAAAVDVQAALAEYPGRTLDGLVYEWRQAFRRDPLVERTPDAWVLRVPERAWADVRERAGVDDDVADALEALHGTGAAADGERQDGVVLVVARD